MANLEMLAREDDAPAMRNFQLRVMCAHSYHFPQGLTAESDTFVSATVVRTSDRQFTPVCWNDANPSWYHTLSFGSVNDSDIIRVELCHYLPHATSPVLGAVDVRLCDMLARTAAVLPHNPYGTPQRLNAFLQRELAIDLPLHCTAGGSKQSSGSISLLLVDSSLVASLEKSAPAVWYTKFEIHKVNAAISDAHVVQKATSALRKVNNATKQLHPVLDLSHTASHIMGSQCTYSVRLKHVHRIFGAKRQHWNREYDAAKRIFKGPFAPALQKALITQHAYLYGSSAAVDNVPVPFGEVRQRLNQTTGAMIDGAGLVELLGYGMRKGKPRMYTYVVIDDELRFCESSSKFHRDMDSKHAMHAAAAESVLYAGEMHLRRGKGATGHEDTLVVDNGSGTYAPDRQDLPLMRQLLVDNFPGLSVVALDFRYPLPKEYTANVAR